MRLGLFCASRACRPTGGPALPGTLGLKASPSATTTLRSMTRRLLSVAGLLAITQLAGCAYPREVSYYDEECQIMARKMSLDAASVDVLGDCQNDQCIMNLVLGATVLATTTVVSGSIVHVGNVVYWKERNRKCRRDQPSLAPEPSASPAT